MSFNVPEFPLLCNIYRGPWLTRSLAAADVPCNLAMGKREQYYVVINFPPGEGQMLAQLLLPPGTDIRSWMLVGQGDIVEVPAGSSRWYLVVAVDDMGKGFDNEHRFAQIVQMSEHVDPTDWAGCLWPVPMP